MSKVKVITLKETRGGTKHPYMFGHALALLRLQDEKNTKGWEIDDEEWEYKGGEIVLKPKPVVKKPIKNKTVKKKVVSNGNSNGQSNRDGREADK